MDHGEYLQKLRGKIDIIQYRSPLFVKDIIFAMTASVVVLLLLINMSARGGGVAYAAGTTNTVSVYLIGEETEEQAEDEAAEDGEEGEEAEDADEAEAADTQAEEAGEDTEEKQPQEIPKTAQLIRGSELRLSMITKEIDGETCVKVAEILSGGLAEDEEGNVPEGDIYIRQSDLTDSPDDIVRETEVYVRTPATVYAEASGPAIASFAPKGSCLTVTGYDSVNENGYVNKYKVEYQTADGETAEGYVYGKYMTDTQEKADAVYNDNGIFDKVKKDRFGRNLYAGEATDLDYYPFEKPVIEGNEFLTNARAMYLNCAAAVKPTKYIKIINETGCNAAVIDIKDGVLAYESEVAKELSPTSFKTAYATEEDYGKGIAAIKETGVYLIGRIVVFNDPLYAKDHPEECIKYEGSTDWPSAYSRACWEYNVRLAQEAIEKFGFNEIQFDYVRFPEASFTMSASGAAKFRNKYHEEKGQAIQNFCFYAADQIHEAGAYISVDVFGESAYGYMTAYGQYWPAISNIVDAISGMPYTDHTGGPGAWEHPYKTMKSWGKRAKKKQDYLENPAVARTWITGYNTPYWNPTENYGEKQLKAQIKGLKDAGLEGGFIPWNVLNDIGKYRQYKNIWNAPD